MSGRHGRIDNLAATDRRQRAPLSSVGRKMARNVAVAALLLRRNGGYSGLRPASASPSSSSSLRRRRLRHHAFVGSAGSGSHNEARVRTVGRKFASSPSPSPATTSGNDPQMPEILRGPPLHPSDLFDGTVPHPKSLSPSSASEFKSCPQSYLFQYLYGIRQPTNLALAKGRLCHTALERVFDLEPKERTLEHLQNLLRVAWSQERMEESYRHLFDVPCGGGENGDEGGRSGGEARRDVEAEIEWGRSALRLLENYVKLEDPRLVPAPNPLAREIWVSAKLAVVGQDGGGSGGIDDPDSPETFLVRGIVDRIDLVNGPYLRIVDYKTGKAPNFKYSPAMNERIAEEAFWQLKIYALLLRKMMAAAAPDGGEGRKTALPANLRAGIDVRTLRLLFLTSQEGNGKFLDMDLGETEDEREGVLREVHEDLSGIWTSIRTLVETQDASAFVHCDRSFCWCHRVRPHFVPGTLWERDI